MKKICCLVLCLLLALASPLSALAEPQSWLYPWISRRGAVQSSDAVLTIHFDPDAVLTAIDWFFDAELALFEELLPYSEQRDVKADDWEEADYGEDLVDWEDLVKTMKQTVNTARATAKAYVPAVALLADSAEIAFHTGENFACYDFRVGGKSWFTLNLIVRPEEGDALLTSDLFPACALSIPQGSGDALSDLPDAYGGMTQALLTFFRDLLATLPEYEGFDFMGQLYEAQVQALSLLEAEGLAHREGDALVYETTITAPGAQTSLSDEALDRLYESRALDVDERVYRLRDLIAPLADAVSEAEAFDYWEEEGTPAALPVLGDDPTDEEYENAWNEYIRLMYRNRRETTTETRRTVLEVGEITMEYDVTVSTRYEPIADETGTLEKLLERYDDLADIFQDYESQTLSASRLTPEAMEMRRLPGYREEVFLVDAGAENEIVFSLTMNYLTDEYRDASEAVELRLTRTDEGQQWTLTLPLTTEFSVNEMTDKNDAGTLRVSLSLDNEATWMDLTLSMPDRDLGSARAEYAYSSEPAAAPDVSGLTVIPYDDDEAMKALHADFLATGIPKLNRQILTGLPAGAQSLIVPLLAAVAALGQMGK